MAEGIHVLVVDDDADVRGLLAAVLESDGGTKVTEAASGAEAMASLGREEFDVAVVDLQLPDHSGLEILRWARAAEVDTELIVLTGHADVETAVEAMRLGAYDFITKPCKNVELREVVNKAAEKKQAAARKKAPPHDELFNLADDPAETRDVHAAHPDLVARMKSRCFFSLPSTIHSSVLLITSHTVFSGSISVCSWST